MSTAPSQPGLGRRATRNPNHLAIASTSTGGFRAPYARKIRVATCSGRSPGFRESLKCCHCGFSSRAVAILDHLGVAYESVDVLQDMDVRQGIKAFSEWPTVPQLYVKGEFVGGSDIMMEMYEAGELQQLMADGGVKPAA